MRYKTGRTCVFNVNYHIVWCVKYRKKVLTPQICDELYTIAHDTAKEKGFQIAEIKVGEQDHVHCFVSAPPKLSITQIVKYLKGISGIQLFNRFPELRKGLWKGQLWNNSYFVETIGSTSEENVRRYIERQLDHQI